jgi:Zn-dependent protease
MFDSRDDYRDAITLGLGGSHGPKGVVTDETMSLLDELRSPPTRKWAKQLGVLAVSLILFVSLGLLRWSAEDLVLLVIVIFIHESGHYLAMRAFGYRDIQMFFVPLFGAAVTASESGAPGYQRTLVALAGPVPGVLVGLMLAFAYLVGGGEMLMRAAAMFLLLNAFNLLPLLPLDGGHVLKETVFCRGRRLEVVFQGAAAAGLLLLALSARDWVLGLLGWSMLLSVRSTFRLSGIVQRLRESGEAASVHSAHDATPEFVARATDEIESNFGRIPGRAAVIGALRMVMDRLHPQPPSAGATVLLLGAYAAAIAMAFVGAMLIVVRNMPSSTLEQ